MPAFDNYHCPRSRIENRHIAHFADDDHEVRFCTQLNGKPSWFVPFNRRCNDGAGSPPNPDGLKTDDLRKEIVTPRGLAEIIENKARIVEKKDPKSGKMERDPIFPRDHQPALREFIGCGKKVIM